MTAAKSLTGNSNSKHGPSRKYRWLIALILLMGIGLASYYGLQIRNDRAIAAEKARFSQAEREVADLSRQITVSVGEPIEQQSRNYCSRPSVKYGQGELSCNITHNLFYGVENEAEATKIYRDVSSRSKINWVLTDVETSFNLNNSKEFTPLPSSGYSRDNDRQRILENYFSKYTKIKCNSNFTFYDAFEPPYDEYPEYNVTPSVLGLGISCGDSTMSAYYDLDE